MLHIAVAIIVIKTLRFKFIADDVSVSIFETVGLKPYGRISIDILELIAGILLLIPKTVWAGATSTIAIISGAIMMHLTELGNDIQGDGGVLFYKAIVTFIFSAVILYLQRRHVPFTGKKLSF